MLSNLSKLTSTLNCCATFHVAVTLQEFSRYGPIQSIFFRNAEVDNESTNPAQHSFTTTNSSIRRIPTFRREIVSRQSSWFPTAVLSYLQNILSINDRAHELPSLDGLTDTAEVPLMPVNGDDVSIPKRNNICNTSFVLRIVCLARAIRTLLHGCTWI